LRDKNDMRRENSYNRLCQKHQNGKKHLQKRLIKDFNLSFLHALHVRIIQKPKIGELDVFHIRYI